jgi:VanZ family protein
MRTRFESATLYHLAAITIRVGAWASVVALAALSLVPSEHITRTDLGGSVEHLAGYTCAAIAVATAYSERGALRILLTLLAYAGFLEFLQRFSPGRTSSLGDFMFSAWGVLLGVTGVVLSKRLLPWSVAAAGRPTGRNDNREG